MNNKILFCFRPSSTHPLPMTGSATISQLIITIRLQHPVLSSRSSPSSPSGKLNLMTNGCKLTRRESLSSTLTSLQERNSCPFPTVTKAEEHGQGSEEPWGKDGTYPVCCQTEWGCWNWMWVGEWQHTHNGFIISDILRRHRRREMDGRYFLQLDMCHPLATHSALHMHRVSDASLAVNWFMESPTEF